MLNLMLIAAEFSTQNTADRYQPFYFERRDPAGNVNKFEFRAIAINRKSEHAKISCRFQIP